MVATFTGTAGERFGKYRILGQLGAGGMGAVYHAVNEENATQVALKLLPPEASRDPRRLARFRREALHGERLHHPNIVAQLEFGYHDNAHYLALEYVNGIDVEACIANHGPLSPADAYRIILQVAKALDHAYEHGVVHRDVKPSNILLSWQQGRLVAKLADLGLARAAGTAESRMTSDGCTVGTVDFMAPEQARDSGKADTRSDLYSLGCTLFYMLAGMPPFSSGTVLERVVKHAKAAPPNLCEINPSIPAPLWDVCRRLLAKRPADRYQTPAELLIALTSLSSLISETDSCGGTTQAAAAGRLASPAVSRLHGRSPAAATPARQPSTSRIPSLAAVSNSLDITRESASARTDGERRVAFEQYEHARLALDAGNDDYALALLLACCRLAPDDLTYRQALRRAQLQRRGTRSWRAVPLQWFYRARFELWRRLGRHLQALSDGEELLTCNPHDLPIQLAMAEAARAAHLTELAVWLLEQARASDPQNRAILRPLAQLYEDKGDTRQAKRLWEALLEADKHDEQARRHLQNLLVQQTSIVSGAEDRTSDGVRRRERRRLIT